MSSRSSSAGLSPADAAAGVLKKGLLLKQGAVVRSWKERYFRLTAQALSYYDPADYDATNPGSTSNKAKGSIVLSDVTAVTPLKSRGAFQVTVAANPTTGVAGRDYLLVAPSDTERKAWMEAIQRAMLAPSRSALVLRQATELQKRGQLCSREAEVIRAWLVSGRDEDVDAAIDVMAAAARVPASERGSDRMEGLLLDFRLAESEGQLLRSLQGLKTVFEEEDTTASIRDRLMDIAMSQYARSADRERDADKDKAKERAKSQPRERSGTGGGDDGLAGGAGDAGAAGGAGRDGDGAASGSRSRAASSHRGKLPSSGSSATSGSVSGSGAASGGGLSPASWTPTCQDLLSLVLHAIAMRVHAAETGHAETLAALQAHPGEDAEEEAAAAAAAYEAELAAAPGHGFEHAGTGEGEGYDGAAHGDGASSGSGSGAVAGMVRSPQASRGSASSASASASAPALGSGEEDLLAPLREEGRVTDDYVLGDKIGEGAYSVVYRALHAGTGEPVAIKVARKASLSPAELRRLVDEVVIMAGLDHVHVVRLHAFYEDGDAFYIVTELMTGGELFDRIVSRSVYGEREARDIVRTLAEALDYCHAHGVVHRDLKPENILLSSPDESRALIKIADMGFAKRLHPAYYAFFDARGARKADSYDMPPPPDKAAAIAAAAAAAATAAGASGTSPATTGAGATPAAPASGSSSTSSPSGLWDPSDLGLATSCGTPSYVSPEILLGKRYGPAVDMWSLGVIAYILLCGYAPFAASNQTDLFRLIVAGRYQFDSPYWDRVSPEAKDLIRRLLVTDPTRRATAREVLAHRWLQGTVSSVELSSTLGQMRLFQASRKQVIRRGPLRKVGHFVRSTKLRLFVLTSDALEYYEPEKDRDRDRDRDREGDADGLGLAEPSASPALSGQSGNTSFDSGLDAAGGPPSLLAPGPWAGSGSGSGGSSAHRVQSWRGTSAGDRERERSSASVATFTSAAPSVAGPSGLGSGGPASVSGGSGASVSGTGFLAIVGLGSGSARSERPKGSIPVRDIRGVCACDAAGKELPAQRVPSVGQSATVVPAHFAAAPPPLTVAGGSSLAPVPEGGADDDNASASLVGPGGGGRAMSRTQSGGAGLLRSDSMGSTSGSGSGSGSGSALSGGAGFWFKIATAGGRDFLLCADSEASRSEWIRALTFTLQRGDLMRKAQVALAGERMAEAVALMKLAADWASLMAAPEAGGSGSGSGVGSAISRASLRLKSLADSAAASASSVATGIASAISSTVAPARPSVISSGGAAGAGPGGGAAAAAAGGAGSQAQRNARASLFAGSNPMAGSGSGTGSSVAAGGPASVAGSVVGPGPGSVAGASAAGGSTGSGGSASAGGPGAPLPSTLSTVALRTHDPLTEDWGRATRIVSKVTRHKAALRARGSIGGAAYSPQLVPGANTATTAAGGGTGSGGSPSPVGSLPKSLPAASPGKHAASSALAQQSARSPAASKAPAPAAAAAAAAPTPASPSAEPAQVLDAAAAASSVSPGPSGPSDAPTVAAALALAAAAEAPAAAAAPAPSEPAATVDAPAVAPALAPAAGEPEAGVDADADADADAAASSAAAAAAAISSKAAALLGVDARAGVASAKAAALLGLDPKTGKPVVDAGPAPPPATSAKAAALLGLGGSMRMRTAAAAGAGTASSSRALPAGLGSPSPSPAAAPEADAGER